MTPRRREGLIGWVRSQARDFSLPKTLPEAFAGLPVAMSFLPKADPEERRLEGPFGAHTGFYSLEDRYPVFYLQRITRRKKAVYPATVVGIPHKEDC